MASGTVNNTAAIDLSSTITTSLPTGVTAATIKVARSGNTVQVYAVITRNSTSLNSFATIASGLPKPLLSPISVSGTTYGTGFGFIGSDTYVRQMVAMVTNNGELRIARGGAAGNYVLAFCYITKD